jgi:hypothetical protein
VSYAELPPLLVRALLAAEDVRFFQHRGVDLQAVARADGGVAWSAEADHPALCRYIDESRARAVYLVGRHADRLAAELDRPGRAARPLAAPQQMSLFP